jgi:GTP cyclohydrolase IA
MKEFVMKDSFAKIISEIGEDLTRDGLVKTPERAAKAFMDITSGYRESLDEIINGAFFSTPNKDMVLVQDIEFYSLCEHHLLPFSGKCHVGYIPNGKVIGLSKIARIVEHFARRLQIQEAMTNQIADAIKGLLNPHGVAVVVEAQHFCMMMRGVVKQHATMKTSTFMGSFEEDNVRQQFFSLINR